EQAINGAEVEGFFELCVTARGQQLGCRAFGEGVGRLGDGSADADAADARGRQLRDERRARAGHHVDGQRGCFGQLGYGLQVREPGHEQAVRACLLTLARGMGPACGPCCATTPRWAKVLAGRADLGKAGWSWPAVSIPGYVECTAGASGGIRGRGT